MLDISDVSVDLHVPERFRCMGKREFGTIHARPHPVWYGSGKEGGDLLWARCLALLSKRKLLLELKPPMEVNGEDCLEK